MRNLFGFGTLNWFYEVLAMSCGNQRLALYLEQLKPHVVVHAKLLGDVLECELIADSTVTGRRLLEVINELTILLDQEHLQLGGNGLSICELKGDLPIVDFEI